MPGRCLAVRTICPKLRQNSSEIGSADKLSRVWDAGHRIGRVADSIVGSKRVIAERSGGDIQHLAGRAIESTGLAQDVQNPGAGLRPETRVPQRGREIRRIRRGSLKCERYDETPVCADVLLDAGSKLNSVLRPRRGEIQRLPSGGVDHLNGGLVDPQSGVHRRNASAFPLTLSSLASSLTA